jgi:acetyl esterase/lipase
VPIGYLVAVAFVAWCTVFALAPPRPRHSSRSNVSYWFGHLLNELPFVAFYWLLVSTLLAVGQGDIDTPLGWVAFGLAVLTTVGLAVVAWRGLQARAAVDRALREGVDVDSRTGVAAGRRRPPYVRILLAPFLVRRRDVERVANLSYGDAGAKNLLDLYRSRSRPSGGPVLIHLHGGAFRRGRKSREARPLLYRLASQGWVCISANYRLSPAATFPDHLIDVKKVIAWAREHGPEYGADPAVVFVAGSSAGGHLASLAALTPNDPVFQPGFQGADTSIAAAISLYGYYGSLGNDEPTPSSPLAYIGPDAPPFFVAHGDKDTLVLVEDARLFVERLQAASSNPVVYAELPGAQHTFDLFDSLRFEAVVDAIEAFAGWVRTNGAEPRFAGEPPAPA